MAQPIASNANFVINAVSNLGGSDELIGLRSRGVSQRPFDRVDELRQQAELKFRDKERELQDTLEELENKIALLEGVETRTDASTGEIRVELSLTQEQKDELDSSRLEMVSIRKQLRDVQARASRGRGEPRNPASVREYRSRPVDRGGHRDRPRHGPGRAAAARLQRRMKGAGKGA